MDETTLSLHPPLRRCWMKRGQRKLIPGAGPSQYLHVFGAYDWDSGFVSYTTATRKNTDSFVAFLEHLLSDYPHQKLILVIDNASYHRSATAQAALSLYADRILVLWLPTYSPFLNPIERFWLHLKQFVVANRLHLSLDDLYLSLVSFFETQQNRWVHPDRLVFMENFRLLALMNTMRARTTSTSAAWRLFLVALALLLLNLWAYVKWQHLFIPKPGPRQVLHHLLPLARWRLWLWEIIKQHQGFSLEIIVPASAA